MATSDERVDYEINLKIAQALAALKELNASAGSVPEMIANVNRAMQSMADRTGLSIGAVETKFKSVGLAAEQFQKTISEMNQGLPPSLLAGQLGDPLEEALIRGGQPFGEIGAAAGYKAANDARREGLGLGKQEEKSAAMIAAERNAQIAAELRIVAEKEKILALTNAERAAIEQSGAKLSASLLAKQKLADQAVLEKLNAEGTKQAATQDRLVGKEAERLNLLNEEQKLVEKQGAALSQQLKTYDQISKTSSQMMNTLRSFSATQKGQGILGTFLGDYKQAGNTVQQLGAIKTAVGSLSKETGASFTQSGRIIKEQFGQIPGITNQVNQATRQMGKEFEEAGKKSAGSFDAIRVAAGILVSMIVRELFSALVNTFKAGIEYATKFELALYNLANAERIMSKQGIEIAPEDLTGIIDRLQELLPTLSRLDATNAVSQIAIFTKGLGFTKKQVEELAKVTAVLAVKNRAAGLSFQQVFDQIKTGLLTGTTRGLTDLGVNINGAAVKLIAMKMAGVETEEAFGKLNATIQEQYQAQAILQVLVGQSTDELGTINEYLDTNDAKLQRNKASWAELWGTIGRGVANAIPAMDEFFGKWQENIERAQLANALIKTTRGKPFDIIGNLKLQTIYSKIKNGTDLSVKEIEKLKDVLRSLGEEELLNMFPDPSAIKDRFTRELIESLITIKDTATDTSAALSFKEIDLSGAKKELEDLLKDLEKLQEKIDENEADYKIDLGRFDEDALKDRKRAVEDYNLNVLQANRDFSEKKKADNKKYRQKELESELKFQEQMRQLQESFLYNLEDALRERDARQVLRLIDKYRMDKEAAINENALRKKTDAENQAAEQADNKKQLQDKLLVMKEDQAVKLQRMDEDSALKRQRMEEDHVAEMAKLREQLNERILEASNKMAEELGVNEEGAKAIYNLLQGYYGTDGSLAKLTEQGYAKMLLNAQGFLTQLTGIVGQQQALMAVASQQYGVPGGLIGPPSPASMGQYGVPGGLIGPPKPAYIPRQIKKYASGGQFLATRPTPFIAGEAGTEFISVTPLSQMQGSMSSMGGGGSPGGTINLGITLSPELRAEIINKTLDKVALVVEQVRRER